jgi:uncharacterized protein YjbJ (UPF0337 family)
MYAGIAGATVPFPCCAASRGFIAFVSKPLASQLDGFGTCHPGYVSGTTRKEVSMGDKSDRLKGHVKEKTGKASGDPYLAQEGRQDQAKGNLKASGKRAADAFRSLFKR